jgi:hypothetical protein
MRIEVRNGSYGRHTAVIEIIERKPFHKGFVGNFVPHWVRYKGKTYLLKGGIDYAYMHGEPLEAYIDISN